MKKILSSALALIMLLSCLSVTAFAAENPTTTDKGATITVTGSYDPNAFSQVISVDVAWGAMTFTFSSGTEWNPSTHTSSGASGWTAEGNDITLTNHSNADIVAKLSFYSKISGLGGTFYDAAENGNAITDVTLATAVGTLVAEAPTETVYFRMEQGEITQDEANLGTVYLTIINSLTSINATAMAADELKAAVDEALQNDPASLHITMPDDANSEMLAAINETIGTDTTVDLILYGANKTDYDWNDNISVKFICGSHDMSLYTPGNGVSHTLTCSNCDHSTSENCTLTHTPDVTGTHISTCHCGYSVTADCTLGNVSYTWTNDNSTCTASGTCELCGTLVSETTTQIAYDSTLDADGNCYVRATFENAACGEAKTLSYNVTGTTYSVYDANGLTAWAATTGTTAKLMDDVTLGSTLNITGTGTLDLNGYTIKNTESFSDDYLIQVDRTSSLTISDSSNGNGNVSMDRGEQAIRVVAGSLTISGGNYSYTGTYENGHSVYAVAHINKTVFTSLTITGGTFTGGVNVLIHHMAISGGTFDLLDIYTWNATDTMDKLTGGTFGIINDQRKTIGLSNALGDGYSYYDNQTDTVVTPADGTYTIENVTVKATETN